MFMKTNAKAAAFDLNEMLYGSILSDVDFYPK